MKRNGRCIREMEKGGKLVIQIVISVFVFPLCSPFSRESESILFPIVFHTKSKLGPFILFPMFLDTRKDTIFSCAGGRIHMHPSRCITLSLFSSFFYLIYGFF